MGESVPVRIRWSDWVRERPATSYSTWARFRDQPSDPWSIVLTFDNQGQDEVWLAEARFLVEGAPHHWLTAGVTFEMMAGDRVAAVVEVL